MNVPAGCRWAVVAALAAGAASGAATAQPVYLLAPSDALACLTPSAGERGKPEYPAELLERKEGGTVRVELSFADGNSAPAVRELSPRTSTRLVDAVKAHVRSFRVPCLPAGAEPARMVFTFDFIPNDGRKVMAWNPVDAQSPVKEALHHCITRIAKPDTFEYPTRAINLGVQGNFFLRLKFTSATAEPQVTIVDGPRERSLRDSINQWASGLRLPCFNGEPVSFERIYIFRIAGEEREFVNDLTLQQFLGAVTTLPQAVYFDTTKMGCPFDVRVYHRQPYAPNEVGELDSTNADRRPLLSWLASLQLRVTPPYRMLGDSFTVRVPCAVIDL